MSRRRNAYALITLLCGALALPAASWASSGGSALTTLVPASGSSTAPSTAIAPTANPMVSASGGGITLQARASTMLRRGLAFSGTAPSSDAGKTIEIDRSGRQTNWRWALTATATVTADGAFRAAWRTDHIGRFAIRAVISARGVAQAASTTPSLTVTVYLSSIASWYGPGAYGSRTACGQKLRPTTIGVANRTLKCGTQVALYYNGHTMIVPVIDRGPYANHANWDLTQATARALGFDGVASIGAVSLLKP